MTIRLAWAVVCLGCGVIPTSPAAAQRDPAAARELSVLRRELRLQRSRAEAREVAVDNEFTAMRAELGAERRHAESLRIELDRMLWEQRALGALAALLAIAALITARRARTRHALVESRTDEQELLAGVKRARERLQQLEEGSSSGVVS